MTFDIFIDNTDRHNGNIFIDKKTRQFYVIDIDHGLKSALTLLADLHSTIALFEEWMNLTENIVFLLICTNEKNKKYLEYNAIIEKYKKNYQ